jgi:hypothetical protein
VDCIALRPWLVYMRVQDFFLCVCWGGGGATPGHIGQSTIGYLQLPNIL